VKNGTIVIYLEKTVKDQVQRVIYDTNT